MPRILCDSCFWFGLCDPHDPYHLSSKDWFEYFEGLYNLELVIPFPSMYETLRTEFCKRESGMADFNRAFEKYGVLIPDNLYRENAFEFVRSKANTQTRHFSFVDAVLRAIILDVNVNVDAIVTNNRGDFDDVANQSHIEVMSLIDNVTFGKKRRSIYIILSI